MDENKVIPVVEDTHETETVVETLQEEKDVSDGLNEDNPNEEAIQEEPQMQNSEAAIKEEPQEHNTEENIQKFDVIEKLIQLEEKMDAMNGLFIQKIQRTAYEEKIVDQMHAELQKYKEDMYSQLVRPILLDIIEVRDSIIRMSKAFAAKPAEEQNVPLKTFSDYSFDIQDILEKNNITIYNCKEGDTFIPIKQRAIKKIKTPVEELHGKVAESLSSGYDYMGKTISPEKVVVYFYEKPENTENTEGENH